MTDVMLCVTGIDLDDERTSEALAAFPDVFWLGTGRMVKAMFEADSKNVAASAVRIARNLQAAVPGLKVLRADKDLVKAADIAGRVKLSREAVRKWSHVDSFPVPYDYVGTDTPVWLWGEIVNWLRNEKAMEIDEFPPSEAQLTQIDARLLELTDVVTREWEVIDRVTTTRLEVSTASMSFEEGASPVKVQGQAS